MKTSVLMLLIVILIFSFSCSEKKDFCAEIMPDNGWSPGEPTPTPEECEEMISLWYGSVEEYEKQKEIEKQNEIEGKDLLENIAPIDSSGNTIYKIDDIAKEYDLLTYDDFSRRYFPQSNDSRLDLIEISISDAIVSQISERNPSDFIEGPYIKISDSSGIHTIDCYLDSINELDQITLDDSINVRGLVDINTSYYSSSIFQLYPCKIGTDIKESVRITSTPEKAEVVAPTVAAAAKPAVAAKPAEVATAKPASPVKALAGVLAIDEFIQGFGNDWESENKADYEYMNTILTLEGGPVIAYSEPFDSVGPSIIVKGIEQSGSPLDIRCEFRDLDPLGNGPFAEIKMYKEKFVKITGIYRSQYFTPYTNPNTDSLSRYVSISDCIVEEVYAPTPETTPTATPEPYVSTKPPETSFVFEINFDPITKKDNGRGSFDDFSTFYLINKQNKPITTTAVKQYNHQNRLVFGLDRLNPSAWWTDLEEPLLNGDYHEIPFTVVKRISGTEPDISMDDFSIVYVIWEFVTIPNNSTEVVQKITCQGSWNKETTCNHGGPYLD